MLRAFKWKPAVGEKWMQFSIDATYLRSTHDNCKPHETKAAMLFILIVFAYGFAFLLHIKYNLISPEAVTASWVEASGLKWNLNHDSTELCYVVWSRHFAVCIIGMVLDTGVSGGRGWWKLKKDSVLRRVVPTWASSSPIYNNNLGGVLPLQ